MEEKKIKLNLNALKIHTEGSESTPPTDNSVETPTENSSTESTPLVSVDDSVTKGESIWEGTITQPDTISNTSSDSHLDIEKSVPLENTPLQESSLAEIVDLPKVSEIWEETKVDGVDVSSQGEQKEIKIEETPVQIVSSDEIPWTPSAITNTANTEKDSLVNTPSENSSETITTNTEVLPTVENTPLEKALEVITSLPSDGITSTEGASQPTETIHTSSEETPTKPLISLNIGTKKEDTSSPSTTNIVQEDSKQPVVEWAKTDDTPRPSLMQKIKLPKINFSAMQKTHQEDEQKVADKKKITDSEVPIEMEVKEKAPELFSNYKPSFDGRAKKFLQHLKEIRLKPRTRNSLVFWLIFCTIAFIGYLFYFHPDKHSISIYKTTITEDIKILTTKKKPLPVENPPDVVVDTTTSSSWVTVETWSTDVPLPVQVDVKNNDTNSWSVSTQREELRKEKIKKYFSK